MKVRQIMHKDLVTIPDTATIHDAASKMKEECVGSVLVVEDDGKLAGIVTDRDVALAVASDHHDLKTVCVYDIMTLDPIVITPETDVDSALKLMNRENVRRLPVCSNGKLVGLLSSADMARELKNEMDQFIGIEEAYAKH